MPTQDKSFAVKPLVIDEPLQVSVSPADIKQDLQYSWLKSRNASIEAALARFKSTEASLSMLVDSYELDYYSNEVLRKKINKEGYGNMLLAQLILAKEHFDKIMAQNKKLSEQQQAELLAMEIELKKLKEKLIEDLIAWRKSQLSYRYARAEEVFATVKESAQGDNDAILMAMEPYHDIVALMMDDVGNFSQITPKNKQAKQTRDLASRRIPLAPVELREKNTGQLRVLTTLTDDKTLEAKAIELDRQWHLYDSNRNRFIADGPEELVALDEEEAIKLDTQAKNLAREYMITAQQLSEESHRVYDGIDSDNQKIRKEILDNINKLKIAENNFFTARKRYQKTPITENGANLVKRFAEYQTASVDAAPVVTRVCEQSAKIIKRYDDAKAQFGDYPSLKVWKAEKQTRKLEKQFKIVEDNIPFYQGEIKDLERKLIKQSIINLMRCVIENNIDFWHQQVSKFFGSKAKINGIEVPQGIASIYSVLDGYDPKKSNEDDILNLINTIIDKRLESGKGFFARRSVDTTHKIYKVIKENINVKKLYAISKDALTNIRSEVDTMRDSKGNGLIKLDSAPKPTDGLSLEMPFSEFISSS